MQEHLSMKKVNEVRERHEDWLMRLPNVVGMVVGLSESGESAGQCGRPVIKVFVSSLLASEEGQQEHKFPTELDGVPVEVEVTGEFRAH